MEESVHSYHTLLVIFNPDTFRTRSKHHDGYYPGQRVALPILFHVRQTTNKRGRLETPMEMLIDK